MVAMCRRPLEPCSMTVKSGRDLGLGEGDAIKDLSFFTNGHRCDTRKYIRH